MLAHVQQFAVASTTGVTETLGQTLSDMSCARTPSWNGRRGWGDHSRRCRHNDRIRFGAAFLTVVFELPLSGLAVVDGEKAVLECRAAVKPAAEVTWYVDMSFAVRSLRVAENGASQPLTSAPRGPLEVSDVTRSRVTLSWLAPTSNEDCEMETDS